MGKFSGVNSSSYIRCGFGRFQNSYGASSCIAVDYGSYANETGLSFCYACDHSTTSSLGSETENSCSICVEGFFGLPLDPCNAQTQKLLNVLQDQLYLGLLQVISEFQVSELVPHQQ
jgi:hypothetical protein